MPVAETQSTHSIDALYSRHHPWLFGWLRRKLCCPDEAADIAHDTFVRILTSQEAVSAMREPRAYLSTTATRLLIDRVRHRQYEQSYMAERGDDDERVPSPESTVAAWQALAAIDAALASLPAKAREAFLLHHHEGWTHASIAARLGVSTRMVRKYLSQAMTELDDSSDDGCHGPVSASTGDISVSAARSGSAPGRRTTRCTSILTTRSAPA